MLEQRATFELFFEQLGLDSSPEAIDEFIARIKLVWMCHCIKLLFGVNHSMTF